MGILQHSIYSFTGHPLPARSLSGCFLATCRLEEVPVARRTLQAAAAGALRCRLGGGTRPAVATAAPGTARSPAPIPQSASENGTHHFPSCHLSDIVPSDINLPPARGAAQPSHILPYAGSFCTDLKILKVFLLGNGGGAHGVEVVDVGMEEGGGVEARQADGGERLCSCPEAVGAQHEAGQQQQIGSVQSMRARLRQSHHPLPSQQHSIHCLTALQQQRAHHR